MFPYTAAIFVSAFLLFLIQPILAKELLPHLGGTPAVWNTSMIFYQSLLLGGYLYAHLSTGWLGMRRQPLIHVALIGASLLFLPVTLHTELWFAPEASPIPWLLLVLLASIGLPFFLLSANAPILQKWYAHTGHPSAGNPYFLYSASNLGSFLALLGYPFLIEPQIRLSEQSWVWSLVYMIFMALMLICARDLLRALRLGRPESMTEAGLAPASDLDRLSAAPTTAVRLRWLVLSIVPASLLHGVTTYISTDLAAVPLLWVVPLALYLLTFVIVFSRFSAVYRRLVNLQTVLILLAAFLIANTTAGVAQVYGLHLLAFFVIALVCHGQLSDARPGPTHLTEFYLWMSLGGVLGGVFNVMVAPILFNSVIEYPLALLIACLLRPEDRGLSRDWRHWVNGGALAALLLAVLVGAYLMHDLVFADDDGALGEYFLAAMFPPVVIFAFLTSIRQNYRLAVMVAVILLARPLVVGDEDRLLLAERNFFGTLRVYQSTERNALVLSHGTTLHGFQSLDHDLRLRPTSYYGRPVQDVFAALDEGLAGQPVATVGLGVGTVTCYGKPGQRFDVYEINPTVIRLASDPQYFSYLSDCPPEVQIIPGDARLSLTDAPDREYGVMILDAYSSDALPMHLLTREALELYLRKLRPGGVLAFHISNRHLSLEPILSRLAEHAGLHALRVLDPGDDALLMKSNWVVMTDNTALSEALMGIDSGWSELASSTLRLWTDDFSNVFDALR